MTRQQSVSLASADGAHSYGVESGTIKLDETWSPFLQASLTVALPVVGAKVDTAALDFLDPRNDNRLTLQATIYELDDATGTSTALNSISSSLSIENRTIDWAAGTVDLTLATDEFELQKNGNDTASPRSYRGKQASLIAVVNAALADAGLSATLDASSIDADVTTTTTLTNQHPDPGVRGSSAGTAYGGWLSGSSTTTVGQPTGAGAIAPSQYASAVPAAAADTVTYYIVGPHGSGDISCNPGDVVTAGYYAYPTSAARSGSLIYRWYDKNGNVIANVTGPTLTLPKSTWTRHSFTATAPAGAASFALYTTLAANNTTGGTYMSNGFVFINQETETDDTTPIAWFSGATAADDYYTYAWDNGVTGVAVASTSTRTPLPAQNRDPDSLTLSPGQSYWDMLDPVVQAAGRALFCDELGVWRLVDGAAYALEGESVTIQNDANATALTDTVDETDSTNVANTIVVKYTWTDAAGNTETAYDVAGSGGPIRTVELDNTPYPGPGRAAYLLKQQTGRGRVMSPTALNDFSARPYMDALVIAPYTQFQTGVVSAVSFDVASGEMSVTTRGLLDTDENAWIADMDTSWLSTPGGDWSTV